MSLQKNLAVLTSSNVGLDVSSAGEDALGLRGFTDSHQADLWLQGRPGSTLVPEIDRFLIGWRLHHQGARPALAYTVCVAGAGGASGTVSDRVADGGGVAMKDGCCRGGLHGEGGDEVVCEARVAVVAAACRRGRGPGLGAVVRDGGGCGKVVRGRGAWGSSGQGNGSGKLGLGG